MTLIAVVVTSVAAVLVMPAALSFVSWLHGASFTMEFRRVTGF